MERRKYISVLSIIFLTMVQYFIYCSIAYCQQSYTIVDLGAMVGGSFSVANDINNRGEVLITANIGSSGHLFLYSGGNVTLLPKPLGYDTISESSINDIGQICVVAGPVGSQSAFLYSNNNFYSMSIAAANFIGGIDLNNNGQAVWFTDGINNSYIYEFSSRTTTALNTMQAYSINDSGQIAGYAPYTTGPDGQTVILDAYGQLTPIGTLGGNYSQPTQIHNSGHVVGSSNVTNNGSNHAFLWAPSEGMKDLNDDSMAAYSHASGVNTRQEVVGNYQAPSSSTYRAFIYSNSTMKNLNDMIAPGSGWVLNTAQAINDCGQITGYGTKDGETRAFLLNPQYTSLTGDFAPGDCDVDGSDLSALIANMSLIDLATFAQNFGKNVCQ